MRGGITERVLRATAASYVVSPAAIAETRRPARGGRATGSRRATSITLAGRVRARGRRPRPQGRCQRAAAPDVQPSTPRSASARPTTAPRSPTTLTAAVVDLVARYHDDDGRPHRLVVAAHPKPADESRRDAPSQHAHEPGGDADDHPRSPASLRARARASPAHPSRCGTPSPRRRASASWMMPTELDARLGGEVTFHMGPDAPSHGRVTAFEPTSPDRLRGGLGDRSWATPAPTSPRSLTEFLVEARSGGTCVVRVVTSAFGTGADWENEFWDEMERGWAPMLDNLRLYLTHFPGQRATPLCGGRHVRRPRRRLRSLPCAGTSVSQRGRRRRSPRWGPTGRRRAIDRPALPRARRRSPSTGSLSFFVVRRRRQRARCTCRATCSPSGAADYVEREQAAGRRGSTGSRPSTRPERDAGMNDTAMLDRRAWQHRRHGCRRRGDRRRDGRRSGGCSPTPSSPA